MPKCWRGELDPDRVHEADRPDEPKGQRQKGERGVADATNHEEAQRSHDTEGIGGALHIVTSRVSTKARIVASRLSRNAADISSLDSAGAPVTPTRTSGKAARRRSTAPRMASMA